MKLSIHLSTAIAGAAIVHAITNDAAASLLFFASAGLIDTDHVLDYFLIHRKLDFGRMLKGHFYKDKIFVLLHSAEIPIAALLFAPGVQASAFAAGYFLHLALDIIEYPFRNPLLTYFLSYRVAVGFSKQKLCSSASDWE